MHVLAHTHAYTDTWADIHIHTYTHTHAHTRLHMHTPQLDWFKQLHQVRLLTPAIHPTNNAELAVFRMTKSPGTP